MLPPVPYFSDFVAQANRVALDWSNWFRAVLASLNNAALALARVVASAQTATMATTTLTTLPAISGASAYRVNYTAQVTTAASISSSLTIAFGWTAASVACSQSFGPFTTNTTHTTPNAVFMIQADPATDVTYTVTYASAGTAMAYSFVATIEALP